MWINIAVERCGSPFSLLLLFSLSSSTVQTAKWFKDFVWILVQKICHALTGQPGGVSELYFKDIVLHSKSELVCHIWCAPKCRKSTTDLCRHLHAHVFAPCWNSGALILLSLCLGEYPVSQDCPQKLMRRDPPKFFFYYTLFEDVNMKCQKSNAYKKECHLQFQMWRVIMKFT